MSHYVTQLAALHSAITRADVSPMTQWLKPATPHTRTGIYINGYHERLKKAVLADYPALTHYLGLKKCTGYVEEFTRTTIPTQWDLNLYSIPFAQFIARIEPQTAAADLATLESTITETFWQPETTPITAQEFSAFTEETLAKARFSVGSSKLLALTYDADNYLTAFRNGTALHNMAQGHHPFLILRYKQEVTRLKLEPTEHKMLSALAAGHTFEQAITSTNEPETSLAPTLSRYIARWLEYGVLYKS